MSNVLSDPTKWTDLQGANPPAWWDGTEYTWSADRGNWFALLLVNPVAGDTVEGVVNYSRDDGDTELGCLNWIVDNEVIQSWALPGDSGTVAINVTIDSSGGDAMLALTFFADQTSPTQHYDGSLQIAVPAAAVSYNCECDDDYPRTTLAALRKRLLRRLGFSAQANNPPPGMADLLDDFIRSAQELLFRRYSVFRRERFYTWNLVPGTRFYDLDANADACTKKLDPRMISWAGISQGDGSWRPLYCGIDPVMYTARGPGIPSHYEGRQCIELWPAPADDTWKLRIKGQFGLMPLEADDDETTVEEEAIFLLALANAKAHYGQPDAGNYASQLTSYVRDLLRGGHHTRRYIPGTSDPRNAVRPVPVGGWPEDNQ